MLRVHSSLSAGHLIYWVSKGPEVSHGGRGSCFKMAVDQERRALGEVALPGHKSGLAQSQLGRLGKNNY